MDNTTLLIIIVILLLVARHFRPHMRHGFELDRAIAQLKREGRITDARRSGSRGAAAVGFELVNDQA